MTIDPKVLLIDMTPIPGAAATSALKAMLFEGWREGALLHLMESSPGRIALADGFGEERLVSNSADAARAIIETFRPELIIYRPVAERPQLHSLALQIINLSEAAYAVWMMDDWPERLRYNDPVSYEKIDSDLAQLFANSSINFAISPGMAKAFSERYGTDFTVAHNALAPEDWPRAVNNPEFSPTDPFIIRYAGSLAPDTTLDTVYSVAKAVSSLAESNRKIQFEGRTHPQWHNSHAKMFNRLKNVTLKRTNYTPSEYRRWLSAADAILVGYNFDETTRLYLRYSFAHKALEALASGKPVLAIGPPDIETMKFFRETKLAFLVEEPSPETIQKVLAEILDLPDRGRKIGARAQTYVFDHFDLRTTTNEFRSHLASAARPNMSLEEEAPRPDKAQFDECRFVFEVLDAGHNVGVMIDVGAHTGGAMTPFAKAGWRVFAFEPDRQNRAALLSSAAGKLDNVVVSAQAVGDKELSDIAFYRSDVSTGISSLTAFHESHVSAGTVDLTTLNSVISEAALECIDFLKIDVEGYEMDVLNGLDFSTIKPRAIVAEFENAKTRDRGFSMGDLAEEFRNQGYNVYVSEWHSIEQYGVQHSWRRLRAYPYEPPESAWGNLIALLDQPEGAIIDKAFRAARSGGNAGASSSGTVALITDPVKRPLHVRIVGRIKRILQNFAKDSLSL